jgi:hypothetical protein
MTETMAIDKSEWQKQLDDVTERHDGEMVTIEVLDTEWGDAHEAEQLPFGYVNYDPKDDVVVVGVGGRSAQWPVVLRHMVWHPTKLEMAQFDSSTALQVTEPDGTVTLVTISPRRG